MKSCHRLVVSVVLPCLWGCETQGFAIRAADSPVLGVEHRRVRDGDGDRPAYLVESGPRPTADEARASQEFAGVMLGALGGLTWGGSLQNGFGDRGSLVGFGGMCLSVGAGLILWALIEQALDDSSLTAPERTSSR